MTGVLITRCVCLNMPFDQLLESKFWDDNFYQDFDYRHQPTLFQPVGGMDMIVEGFLRQIGKLITYNAPVVGIELQEKKKGASKDGVSVKYMNGATVVTATADYCVSKHPVSGADEDPHQLLR